MGTTPDDWRQGTWALLAPSGAIAPAPAKAALNGAFDNKITGVVQETQVPNLAVMSSGPKPINATEMFESQLLPCFAKNRIGDESVKRARPLLDCDGEPPSLCRRRRVHADAGRLARRSADRFARPALALGGNPPAKAFLEVLEALWTHPVVLRSCRMLVGRRVPLGQDRRVRLDRRPMILREGRIHELRPAERAVIVLPFVAVRPVPLPHQ